MNSRAEHVSVVVPTYGRPDGLIRLLRGLAVQQPPGVSWDIVVVDNNNDASARRVTEDAFRTEGVGLPVPARLVHEKQTGASNARNRGIAEASGTIVVFVDDDVVPSADWLAKLLAPILAGRSSASGGRVVLDPEVPRPRWFASWMPPFFAAFELGDREADVRELLDIIGRPFVLTASAAFRRDLLVQTGGFDPRLGPREGAPTMCDDIELCVRYQELGGTLRYVPDSVVVHDLPASRLTRTYLVRRWYWHGRSTWLLDEAAFRSAKFLGVRSLYRAFFETWRAARRNKDTHIALRMLLDAAFRLGLLVEGVSQVRHGVRGWRTGTPARTSAFGDANNERPL